MKWKIMAPCLKPPDMGCQWMSMDVILPISISGAKQTTVTATAMKTETSPAGCAHEKSDDSRARTNEGPATYQLKIGSS